MKKICILVLMLMITIISSMYIPFETKAETIEPMSIIVDTKQCIAGEKININISLKNNPGITSIKLDVTYNDRILTLDKVEYNSEMVGQTLLPEVNKSPFTLIWLSPLENVKYDGIFATLTFTVSETALNGQAGNINITYDSENIYNLAEKT